MLKKWFFPGLKKYPEYENPSFICIIVISHELTQICAYNEQKFNGSYKFKNLQEKISTGSRFPHKILFYVVVSEGKKALPLYWPRHKIISLFNIKYFNVVVNVVSAVRYKRSKYKRPYRKITLKLSNLWRHFLFKTQALATLRPCSYFKKSQRKTNKTSALKKINKSCSQFSF